MDPDTLYDAALAGDVDAIAKLDMQADLLDEDSETILHLESRNGNTERVLFILREFANKNLLAKINKFKQTALHLASFWGCTEVAEILIDAARHLRSSSANHDHVTSFQAFLRQGDEDMDTALHSAVMKGHVEIVKLFVEADPTDRHIQNHKGKTPIYIAVEKGFNEIVEIISTTSEAPSLDGPDCSSVVRIKNLDQDKGPGGTHYKIVDKDAFYAAAFAGDADAIAKLEMQADILNKYDETILHIESENGNTEHVRFILREFANKNLLVKISKNKSTALHLAAYIGRTEVVEVLINAARQHMSETSFQAFLRQGDEDMDTALHSAVTNGHVDIVKLLVEADPTDRHIQNGKGKTPMYIAVEKGLDNIVDIISTTCRAPSLDGPNGSTALCITNLDQDTSPGGPFYKIMDKDALYAAAIAGDVDAIAKLEMQADILNVDDETILHIESQNENTEHVRFILREFANKNLLTKLSKYKRTALHLAAYYGRTEVAEVLIDAATHLSSSSDDDNPVTCFQAFLRQGDKNMDTALHIAATNGHLAMVKLLVNTDPQDGRIPNDEGKTPIYLAAEKGYTGIVKVICTTCTAPLNLDGPGGSTALHAAVKNPNHDTEVVEVLIVAARLLPSALDNTAASDEDDDGEEEEEEEEEEDKDDDEDKDDEEAEEEDDDDDDDDDDEDEEEEDDEDEDPVSSFEAFLRRGDEDWNTALQLAVMQGNLTTAKLLVEADPSDRGIVNIKKKTPFYSAVEKRRVDIVKMMWTSCTAPLYLHGPDDSSLTALHAVVKNLDEGKKEVRDVMKMIIDVLKSEFISRKQDEYTIYRSFTEEVFSQTDEFGQTILELAVDRNYVDVVELILDVHDLVGDHFISLMPLIYKAKEKGHNNMLKLLNERYEVGATSSVALKNQASLISAIRRRDTVSATSLLDEYAEELVTFADSLKWTALHHAVYNEFNSLLKPIVEAQKKFGHEFLYPRMTSTPFHLAAEKGYKFTLTHLMKLWPSWSSSYTAVDKNRRNILHLVALQSKKEMVQGILENCAKEYKKELVNKQDNNGNTPLHILIRDGCFVPQLIRYEGLRIRVKNEEKLSPEDMLYLTDEIIKDQVQIKIALDHVQINQKRDIFSLSLTKRASKDVIFLTQANLLIHGKLARMKDDDRAVANCFADAIAEDPISKAALEREADTLQEEGKTILHVQSMRGITEHVRYIVREFANRNILVKRDTLKQTALHLAAHHGHTQVVEILIDAARRDLPSSSANDDTHNPVGSFQDFIRQANSQMGNTALHLAVLNGNVAIVKLLLEADPNDSHVHNYEGKNPIYIAAENGDKDIVKEICTTCTALCLDGPGGRTTALHAVFQNIGQVREGAGDMIRVIIDAAKRWNNVDFEALFCRTDESGSTILQLAVERNYVDAVRLILLEDPAYQHGRELKRNGLMLLIFKAIDNKCSDHIIKLLSQTYEDGINPRHQGVMALILAIKRRDEDSVLRLLGDDKDLVTFTEDNGWTPLHYAVYHEFDSILGAMIEAQEYVGHQFVYENMVSTPFHVAIEHGYTSTLVRLMQLWPAMSSASMVDNSPYTVVNKDGQNILHLAAADNRKEMVQGILKYCPGMCKDKILKQQDTNADTPLHLLISQGCFIPELIKDKGLDTMPKNKNDFTPWEMLYFKNDVVADQVEIKIAIDDVQTNQSAWKFWDKSMEKKTDIWKSIPPSKLRMKDVIFDERKKKLIDAKHEQRKKDLERYKMRTNTQIIVTALITTVTFTVGFTMPGGLRQSGEVDEGLVLLSKKTAFNAFMVSDALALLLSTSSLFFYFLESMNEDPRQVSKLNAASTVLNIVSVMAMMLTFIAGTYLVLSRSPALAITVCIIGSLFFLLIIVLLTKMVYDRLHVKGNLD